MAPMTRRMAAEDGVPTDAIVDYYRRRARHEVGLIISEGTAIDALHAFDTLTVPRFETGAQLAGWRRVVEAVHAEGGVFAPQLWHTGRLGASPIGPSPGTAPPKRDGGPRPPTRPMERADFEQVLGAYRHAARSAAEIGCDALEIHGAHGYLLDSFLSPVNNLRTDEYGGSAENRMRFPLEVVRAVRREVGPAFPVIYRFSQWKVDDHREIKFHQPADLDLLVRALGAAGVDILHVSTRDALDPGFPDQGPLTLAGWTRRLSGLPVIAVGKVSVTLPMDRSYGGAADVVTDPGPALDLLERGEADLLAVGRALIANPDWVEVVRSGRWRDLKPYHVGLLDSLV
jgi:2,4-dienoyl-CoA reductase-like NADH-dependent reductase (Old Yellow Enzyme family)